MQRMPITWNTMIQTYPAVKPYFCKTKANRNTFSEATEYTAWKFTVAVEPTIANCLLRVEMV